MKAFEREFLGARETRGPGRRERNACQEAIVSAIPPTNCVCKNNATVKDQLSSKPDYDTLIFSFCFPKTRNLN